jgi:hypothetical protein
MKYVAAAASIAFSVGASTETNYAPKPFIWTADPDKIITAVDRGRQALASRALG